MEINWGQVIATVLGSSVISALLTGLWLNVRTERIKTELQRSLYEFQTKYSLYHQRKAEAIREVFTEFARNEVQLKKLNEFTNQIVVFDANFDNEEIKNVAGALKQESLDILKELEITCNSSKIYLDPNICDEIDKVFLYQKELIAENVAQINVRYGLDRAVGSEALKSESLKRKIKTDEKMNDKALTNLKKNLVNQFRQLLSAENSNNQLEENQ